MKIKKDIFENNACPFTVPEEYFDSLQKRIMSRIQSEEDRPKVQSRTIKMPLFRNLVAAAACILFIFVGAALYVTYMNERFTVAESVIDEEFYHWIYASDRTTQMAESLDIQIPENIMTQETGFSEEDEAIIRFLERDNINVVAILYSIDDETFLIH